MSRFTPVTPSQHQTKSWSGPPNYRFSSGDMLLPLCSGELSSAAASLVIGFLRQPTGVQTLALVGLEADVNLMVGPDGAWQGDHIPYVLNYYPFGMGLTPDGNYILCVADPSELVRDDATGRPFFTFDGVIHPAVKEILNAMSAYEGQKGLCARFAKELDAAGVLQPLVIEAPTRDGTRKVEGLLRVDERLLSELSDELFLGLRNSGALGLAYCQMISMHNIPKLVAKAKSRLLSAPAASAAMELDFSSLMR